MQTLKKFKLLLFSQKRMVLAAAITLAVSLYVFSGINVNLVFKYIGSANALMLFGALIVSVFHNYFVSAYRWHAILKRFKENITYQQALFIKIGNEPLVSTMPALTGEGGRILYLKKVFGMNATAAAFTIGIEYLMNLLILVLISLTAGICSLFQPQAIFMGALTFGGTAIRYSEEPMKKTPVIFKSLSSIIQRIHSMATDGRIFLSSLLLWILEILNFYIIGQALGHPFPLMKGLLLFPLILVITNLPVINGGLGIREGALILFFSSMNPEALTAAGLLFFLIENLIPTLGSLMVMFFYLNNLVGEKQQHKI